MLEYKLPGSKAGQLFSFSFTVCRGEMVEKLKIVFSHSFIKFAAVGFLGTVTNLVLFFIFADIFKFSANITAMTVFLLVGAQNYIFHHSWTFRENTRNGKLSFLGWIKFTITTLLGLGVNIIVLNAILLFYSPPYKVIAQFCGVAFGTLFNYLGSKHLVFNSAAAEKSLG
jgi:putative flippase GtrA